MAAFGAGGGSLADPQEAGAGAADSVNGGEKIVGNDVPPSG